MTPDGVAKVLDFSLAKLTSAEVANDAATTLTTPAPMTQVGIADAILPRYYRGATGEQLSQVAVSPGEPSVGAHPGPVR